MTKHGRRGKKRTNSKTSPPQPDPNKRAKKSATGPIPDNDEASSVASSDTFANNFLASLTDPEIRAELEDILTSCMKSLQEEVATLRTENQGHKVIIDKLSADLIMTKEQLHKAEVAYDQARQDIADLQQYTRRNALRITNPAWKEDDDEDTDALILKLAADLDVDLQPWEISRSHRVGKKRDGYIRPILVKFLGYRIREKMYKARKDLKKHKTLQKVYINEDLTKATSELAYKAREMKRAEKFHDTFTSDGKVFVKKFPASSITLVKNKNKLNHLASLRPFSEVTVPNRNTVDPPRQPVGKAPTTTQSATSTDPTAVPVASSQEPAAPSGTAEAMEQSSDDANRPELSIPVLSPQMPCPSNNTPPPENDSGDETALPLLSEKNPFSELAPNDKD